jgi:hypothetical protein
MVKLGQSHDLKGLQALTLPLTLLLRSTRHP